MLGWLKVMRLMGFFDPVTETYSLMLRTEYATLLVGRLLGRVPLS